MKIFPSLLIIALFTVITHAANDFEMEEFIRELEQHQLHMLRSRKRGRGGGRSRYHGGGHRGSRHGSRPEPTVLITCGTENLCTPRRRRGEVVNENGGVRVCLQHPDETRDEAEDVCMKMIDMTDAGTGATLVFTGDESQCGCCSDDCPGECETCPCTDERYGVEFSGYYMTVTHHRHHWWLSEGETITICVPEGSTEDYRLRGGECIDSGSCPADVNRDSFDELEGSLNLRVRFS